MDKVYKLKKSGKVFKVTEDEKFYTLNYSGKWERDYGIEWIYYDADPDLSYEQIKEEDIPKK